MYWLTTLSFCHLNHYFSYQPKYNFPNLAINKLPVLQNVTSTMSLIILTFRSMIQSKLKIHL